MRRNWRWFIFGAVILLLGWGIWTLNRAKNEYQAQEASMVAELTKLHEQNISLQNELDSLKNPQNLINILKSQTNYVRQGEKLIIITAPNNSATGTATSSR